jgi:hypothetical protein
MEQRYGIFVEIRKTCCFVAGEHSISKPSLIALQIRQRIALNFVSVASDVLQPRWEQIGNVITWFGHNHEETDVPDD